MSLLASPSVVVPNTTVDDGDVPTDDKVPKSKRAVYATAPRSKVSLPVSSTLVHIEERS